jgi:phenylalanyl-tRNA synthetase beta chain
VQVARTQLLPSALKTLSANKDAPLPIRLFEISDVVLIDAEKAVGARNERRLIAVQAARGAGFEVLHGLLNRVMDVLGVPVHAEMGGGLDSTSQPQRCVAFHMACRCNTNTLISAWTTWVREADYSQCGNL